MTETEQAPPRYFRHRETGTVCRVLRTDDSYAYIEVVVPTQSRHALPRAEYDTVWLDWWQPATEFNDPSVGESFDLPANFEAKFAENIAPSVLDLPAAETP